jgi:hypothetical protein
MAHTAHTAHWGSTAQNSLLKQIYGEDRTLEEIGMLAIVPRSTQQRWTKTIFDHGMTPIEWNKIKATRRQIHEHLQPTEELNDFRNALREIADNFPEL